MSICICKKLSSQFRSFTTFSPINKLLHFKYQYFASSAINKFSTQESFTVSYLINSCGFTPKQALSASKYVKLKTPENADSVLAFFKKHGFTGTPISNIVRRLPILLSSDCENTILPKLEYLTSIGFSSAVLTDFVAASPNILGRSLVSSIIPTWNFIKSLLKTNERTIIVARRFFSFGWCRDSEDRVIANIKILRELGVSESAIVSLLTTKPSALMLASDRFKITVEKVKQMGFNPQKVQFVRAIIVLTSLSKSTWEKKVEICKKWGWSEDDVYVAFVKQPNFMTLSEHKMSSIMDMVINKSGFDPSDVVQRPQVFSFSLEKRVVPRCLFYQRVLLERGLVKKKWSLRMLLEPPDKQFMKRITMLYQEAAPELLNLYQEKLEVGTEFSVTSRGIKLYE